MFLVSLTCVCDCSIATSCLVRECCGMQHLTIWSVCENMSLNCCDRMCFLLVTCSVLTLKLRCLSSNICLRVYLFCGMIECVRAEWCKCATGYWDWGRFRLPEWAVLSSDSVVGQSSVPNTLVSYCSSIESDSYTAVRVTATRANKWTSW